MFKSKQRLKRRIKTHRLRKLETKKLLLNSLNDTKSMKMALNTESSLYIKISKYLLEAKVINAN